MSNISAGIVGVGAYVPERVLTNVDLEAFLDTSDEWIRTRTGIRERHIAAVGDAASDLGVKAARAALEDAGVNPEEVDLILVATSSPDMILPSTACFVQEKLGIRGCAAFDLQAACSGFSYALAVGAQFVETGMYKTVLLVGADAMSRFLNWDDRSTCVLFGDGAGACVIQPVEAGYGVLASHLAADGSRSDLLKIPAGGSANPATEDTVRDKLHYITMNGNEIYKFAVRCIPDAVKTILEKACLTVDDIDYLIPHQANMRIIDAAVERLGIDKNKVIVNLDKYGNTSAASIPLAIHELHKKRNLKRGDILVLVGFGAGLTWGANIIRWL
ncbi:MAG TPA: beta-ketoacyl-ACP synthase III [Candidatus Aquicultor sp.]|jgi:3-oxoacyl-[acyl-carrier-protein] synthase-3